MPFIKQLNKDFKIEDKRIVLSEQYKKDNAWKFKKITGSRFSAILSNSKYSSTFKVWCQMVGIYTEPMDPVMAKAGVVIEPKIRQYVADTLKVHYKDYDPKTIGWDLWKEKDWKAEKERIFGGIPDGEPSDATGNLLYGSPCNIPGFEDYPMLEIKTSSIDKFLYKKDKGLMVLQKQADGVTPVVKEVAMKKLSWFNDDGKIVIPTDYRHQLALYLWLRKIHYGIFAVCFLKTEDYTNPEACNVYERDIHFAKLELPDNFDVYIDKAKQWWKDYIETGKSPEMTPEDEKWLKEVEWKQE